jgi:hypothetical protein
MKSRRMGLPKTLLLGFTLLAVLGIGQATAQASAVGERSPVVNLKVNMSAQRFIAHGNKVTAVGPVYARATRASGATTVMRKRVRLRVNATGDCRILELKLAQLYLNLLGLKVQTSAITAEITGNEEGVLGNLFCSLSKGIKLNNTTLAHRATRSINHNLHGRSLQILAFEAPLRPQGGTATPSSLRGVASPSQVITVGEGECEILNLLLGPLHLELLGLVVDLYGKTPEDAVQVLVSGNPSGGLLGNTLCGLATTPATVP